MNYFSLLSFVVANLLGSWSSVAADVKSPREIIKEWDLQKGDKIIDSKNFSSFEIYGFVGTNKIKIKSLSDYWVGFVDINVDKIANYAVVKNFPGKLKIGTLVRVGKKKESGFVEGYFADQTMLIKFASKHNGESKNHKRVKDVPDVDVVVISDDEEALGMNVIFNKGSTIEEEQIMWKSYDAFTLKPGDQFIYKHHVKWVTDSTVMFTTFTVVKNLGHGIVDTDQGQLDLNKKMSKIAFAFSPHDQVGIGDAVRFKIPGYSSYLNGIFMGSFVNGKYLVSSGTQLYRVKDVSFDVLSDHLPE